ncbi:hypothetical protein DSO57_1022275 [Entomophthora muscae]|uniref:Uncharacterized protein n=1 Tax=Entomophthora muscae TaxID=34485 RepID=A0ACC2S532_9FUNG|nr:hypothetical protein DSO57_1022275 [Entomophthora muscae]
MHLKKDIDVTSHNYKALDSDLQEMSNLTKNMGESFSTLIVQALQVSIASRDSGVQQETTLNTLEESILQLWTLQPLVDSEAEFIPEVHVFNSSSQDSPNGSAITGVDLNYKPFFKQVFDPKTLIIVAFLTIYVTAMH